MAKSFVLSFFYCTFANGKTLERGRKPNHNKPNQQNRVGAPSFLKEEEGVAAFGIVFFISVGKRYVCIGRTNPLIFREQILAFGWRPDGFWGTDSFFTGNAGMETECRRLRHGGMKAKKTK